jgi:hypothetical protein
MTRPWLLVGLLAYALTALLLFPLILGVPVDLAFTGDAASYSDAATYLLHHGFYSTDGVHPFFDREPGMSLFLAGVYAFAGDKSALGLFIVQGFLLLLSSLWFCRELSQRSSSRIGGLCFLILLTSGSVLHTVFSAYRECLTLSLFLCFAALLLSQARRRTLGTSILRGTLLGFLILTYYSFVFFPLFLAFVWWRESRSWKDYVIMVAVCFAVVSAWALRNASYDGRFRVIDDRRAAVMWYVRGEQAKQMRGLQPLGCLWSEYVSRDWTGQSPVCSYNGLMHVRWPDGFDLQADYSDVARGGQAAILSHAGWYLWGSVFEIIELHLPFLGGGWSFAYNLYASLTGLILAVGFLLGCTQLLRRDLTFFTVVIFYNTAVFTLTDATPRYLLPVIFCYAVIAAFGYNAALQRFKKHIS